MRMTAQRIRLGLITSFLVLVGATVLSAQNPAPNLSLGTIHQITSAALGSTRTVFVSLPDPYENGSVTYPVLVLLDAEDQFRSVVGSVRFLASRNAIPDMIVVGVANGADRTHDMTPPATGQTAAQNPTAGGADSLLRFITGELLPWTERNYRTSRLRVLAGHSFGGLFAIHAATVQPSPFRVIIAMSPSLWWNDSSAVELYAGRLAARTAPLSLFVTSGSLEPVIDVPTSRFVARVDSSPHPALVLGYRRYPGDGHDLTPFWSLADGLRSAFKTLAVPLDSTFRALLTPLPKDSAVFAGALTALEDRYARAALALDCPTMFPEAPMNTFGYVALQTHPRLGVSIFRINTLRYPESANTYDSYGDGLLAVHDTAGARGAFQRAVSTAKRYNDPVGTVSGAKLAKLGKGGSGPH